MPLAIELHPEAIEEAADARRWYEARSSRAALAFISELDRAMEAIATHPERWPQIDEEARRYLMRWFPYAVVYRPRSHVVLVVAIAHMRRRPGYWRQRS